MSVASMKNYVAGLYNDSNNVSLQALNIANGETNFITLTTNTSDELLINNIPVSGGGSDPNPTFETITLSQTTGPVTLGNSDANTLSLENFSNIKSTNGFLFDAVDSRITLQAGNDNEILLQTAGYVTIEDPTEAQDLYVNLNGVSKLNFNAIAEININHSETLININTDSEIVINSDKDIITYGKSIDFNYNTGINFQNTTTSTTFGFANAVKTDYEFAQVDLPIAINTVISSDLITLPFPISMVLLSINCFLNGDEIDGALYSIITNWDLNKSDATNQSFYIYLGFPNGYDSQLTIVSFRVNYIAFE